MRNSSKLGLLLLGLTLLVIAFIDVTRKQPVDWAHSFDKRDKIPYGLYVTRTELPHILGMETEISDLTSTMYPALRDTLAQHPSSSLVYIVNYFDVSKEAVQELLAFVDKGGEVFISTNDFYNGLLDSLGIRTDYYYPKAFQEIFDFEKRPFFLQNGQTAYYKDLEYPGLFYQLDSADVRIIGSYKVEGRVLPNFIEVKRNKGRFLLHLEPLMFTNFYMLQRDNYAYGASALKLLQGKQLLWYDAHYSAGLSSNTPLRVLLTNDGLRQAWYILLFTLILFLLFRSKRESRPIEVVGPEPNLSKEFAKTIASLYYETGSPGNLVHKKLEYFLYDLRTHYQLDTLKIDEEEFAQRLSMCSGTTLMDCEQLLHLFRSYRKREVFTDKELLFLNQAIEEFKNKANML